MNYLVSLVHLDDDRPTTLDPRTIMSVLALSPVAPEPPSPMITSMTPVTPTLDPASSAPAPPPAVASLHLVPEAPDADSSLGLLAGGGAPLGPDPCRR